MILKDARILIVDDDPDVLTALRLLLKSKVKEVVTVRNPEQIPSLLSLQSFEAILLDMNFCSTLQTGNEGLFWLRKIKDQAPQSSLIMITAYGGVELAVRTLKEGAADFIVKPWQNEKLLQTLEEVLPHSTRRPHSDYVMIGESKAMHQVYRMISKVAPTDANILILGENGTGKDLVADAIHRQSLRADKALIKVDVGALTESLFESELFGHKKGSFTDARQDRIGRFEAAHGGSLFLDEIGNITLQQQSKLLQVLQNRAVTPIGENQSVPIDIRLICATNLPITELSNGLRFRKDLMYRINTVEIILPPLRERGDDVLLLAKHFLQLYANKYFKTDLHLASSAVAKLKSYPFPGNIRELQYMMERAVIMSETETIQATDLLFSYVEQTSKSLTPMSLSELEKESIHQAIERHGGNVSKAAKELGITRTALYRRLFKHGIKE